MEAPMFDFLRKYQPKWLYELLPYLYIAAGIYTIVMIWNAMAIFSGCMLILAGLTVWILRMSYRKDLQETGKTGGRKIEPGLVHVAWHQRFKSGHKQIDEQHRSLFNDANKLIDAITSRRSDLVINETMRELIRNIREHFKTEESLLEKLAPEIAASHKEIHDQLLREAHELADRVYRHAVSPRELIGFLVYDVITNHLAREDSKFFNSLK
jgi:hemerythrin-like metal-binding protein